MRKIIFALLSFLFGFVFFLPFQTVHADSNFDTSLSGTYAVQTSGNTHGSFTVVLKNLTDRYYASSYSLQLGFTDLENIQASDNDGTITPELKKTDAGEEVTFALNHKAIGLGSTETLHFSFDTTNIATKNGSIWEVNIPGLQNSNDFSSFTVSVIVPPSFGNPTYMKPDVGNTLTFTKDQLGESGISIAFGADQVFHFNLAYHLKNDQIFPVHTEIALPPDTTYQHISLDTISPRPLNVTEDQDGNWMAQYSLLPSQILTVHVDGRAFLSLSPSKKPLTPQSLTEYLKPSSYWQTKNTKIQALSEQLQTPYAIYEYVVHTLHYDFARVNDDQKRLGAVDVLQNPSQAVCLEFTDLFIALARSAGIPAREIDGYAYTQNSRERPLSLQKDILHAWPEYYDKTQGTWVMVDPTWENTTGGVDYFHVFDFDHIAFVVKGTDPDYPVPAGGYKLPGQQTQDVTVTFADNTQEPTPQTTFDLSLPSNTLAGLPISAALNLFNTSPVLFPSQHIVLTSNLPEIGDRSILSEDVPPYGHTQMTLTLGKTALLTNHKGTVTILLAGKSITRLLVIVPFSVTIAILGGLITGSLIITLFIIARRSRRVSIP